MNTKTLVLSTLILFSIFGLISNHTIFAQVPDVGPSGCVGEGLWDPYLERYLTCDFESGPGTGGYSDPSGDVAAIYAAGGIMLVAAVGGLSYAVSKNRSGGAKHASSSRQSSGGVRIDGDTPKDLTGGHRPKHMGQPGWQGMIAKPITISDVSYALQDKMYRLKTMDLEKFFEDVGNCIIEAGGALHTTELFARKAEKIFMEQLKKKVSEATGQPLADKILTYDTKLHEYRFKNVTEFAQTMAQFVRDELIDAAGDALPYAKILTVLVDNFGPEITAPYVCMYIHLQKI